MKILNSISLILTFIILISCSENDNDFNPGLPYFEFQSEDTPNLLNLPELNSRLIFVKSILLTRLYRLLLKLISIVFM